jgi:hypothetical protein
MPGAREERGRAVEDLGPGAAGPARLSDEVRGLRLRIALAAERGQRSPLPSTTERMFPDGSVNQATVGPFGPR